MSLALPVLFIGGTMTVAEHAGTALTTGLAVLLAVYGLAQLRPVPAEPASGGGVPVRT